MDGYPSSDDLNAIGDPHAPLCDTDLHEINLYLARVDEYGEEMLNVLNDTNWKEKDLWLEFTATFSECTSMHISLNIAFRWFDFLNLRGALLQNESEYGVRERLMRNLTRNNFDTLERRDNCRRFLEQYPTRESLELHLHIILTKNNVVESEKEMHLREGSRSNVER
ncbi:hypothetical protein FGB62_232g01 [Gracilaria domingensis]|nr:hypothetical protein FGB62_232g01 [Gracilaria domingensis]